MAFHEGGGKETVGLALVGQAPHWADLLGGRDIAVWRLVDARWWAVAAVAGREREGHQDVTGERGLVAVEVTRSRHVGVALAVLSRIDNGQVGVAVTGRRQLYGGARARAGDARLEVGRQVGELEAIGAGGEAGQQVGAVGEGRRGRRDGAGIVVGGHGDAAHPGLEAVTAAAGVVVTVDRARDLVGSARRVADDRQLAAVGSPEVGVAADQVADLHRPCTLRVFAVESGEGITRRRGTVVERSCNGIVVAVVQRIGRGVVEQDVIVIVGVAGGVAGDDHHCGSQGREQRGFEVAAVGGCEIDTEVDVGDHQAITDVEGRADTAAIGDRIDGRVLENDGRRLH